MIVIQCIECGGKKEVNPGRGRRRYFDLDSCRLKHYRRSKTEKTSPEYAEKRAVIDRQYEQARRTSRSPTSLRRRAMGILFEQKWSVSDLSTLFGISEQRVRQIIGRDVKERGKSN